MSKLNDSRLRRDAIVVGGKVLTGVAAGLMMALTVPAAVANEGAATVVAPIKANKVILIDIARAGNRLVAVGERGVVLTSEDNGVNWNAYRVDTTRTLTAVAFADEKLGVTVGHGGALARTEDGGLTWAVIKIEAVGLDSLLNVTAMGGQTFAAYGGFGKFFISTDGGKTWVQKVAIDADFDRHIYKIVPVGDAWFLAGESGNTARSLDKGETWEKLTSPYNGSFFGAVVAQDGTLLAFGMRGSVYASNDVGSTWRKVESGTKTGINGARVLGDGSIIFVGNTGLVAVSRDNGKTIKMKRSPKNQGYGAVVQTQNGELVTAGDAGAGVLDRAMWAE